MSYQEKNLLSDTQKKKLILKVENRSREILLNIIKQYKAQINHLYRPLAWLIKIKNEKLFNNAHGTVNHSKYFKDPMTGVHINTIKGLCSKAKTYILPRNRTKYHTHIFEFL
ncbi:hypothetical protein SteCoe_37690 [Stentor coeruleus]|uniref:Uncharacterized protein n=1 Tax=Stentor coeruleus TaxID=5963 RepID=A0A1R2AMK2_9CILI|nr:hypothetical protein SteCoe_37690 [Stentor coeruleus]